METFAVSLGRQLGWQFREVFSAVPVSPLLANGACVAAE